ncbi:MAG TPA: deoxyribose-phosphate aldolase [Bryobacteraceae bacterium]|nr:deoxyribose-phosphate aldolase [Bryobacteraceae bacterium]
MNTSKKLNQPSDIVSLIDHTLLKPQSTESDVTKLCDEARAFGFASVCVNPYWVHLAATELKDSPVVVCTVIGFPLGANETQTKLHEAELALNRGAKELDVVQNIGALLSGDSSAVLSELTQLANLAHERQARLKVILETCLLNPEQKKLACQLAVNANADFVKTSTGFGAGGATQEDVRLMRSSVGSSIGVKASGGIRTLAALLTMMEAGANRIGTSAGVEIFQQLQSGVRNAS